MDETGHTSPRRGEDLHRSPRRAGTALTSSIVFAGERCRRLDAAARERGCREFVRRWTRPGKRRRTRVQTSLVSGHRADFALMLMDPDPLKIDAVHQRLLAGPLGPALEATFSFVSMTEVSEYVPSVEQYRERLIAEGESDGSPGADGQGEGLRAARTGRCGASG